MSVGAQRFIQIGRRPHDRVDLGIEARREIFGRARPIRSPASGCSTDRLYAGHRAVDGSRIARVMSGDDLQEHGRSGDVVGHRSQLVERAGIGDQAVARDAAVRRFHADDAAEAGRLPDRTARVAANGEGYHSRGHGGGGTSARTARPPARCPRGCGSSGRPSSRSTNPWRIRPCSSCRSGRRRPRGAGGRFPHRRGGRSSAGCDCRRSSTGPFVQTTSLSATGSPARRPNCCPWRRFFSTASACRKVSSRSTCRKALIRSSCVWILVEKGRRHIDG